MQNKYLQAEHEASAELQKWIDAEGDSCLARELGLARWQLSKLIAAGNAPMLVETFIKLVANLEKQNMALMRARREVWTPSERREFLEELQGAIERVLKRKTPNHWQQIMSAIGDEFAATPQPRLEHHD